MTETFCAWCLKSKNRPASGNNYCIDCRRFLCYGCAESHLIKDPSHRILAATKVRFCDKCNHVNACAFCWDCKLFFCDLCSAKHTSADDTSSHSLEIHSWTTDEKPKQQGALQTAVIGISGQGHLRDQTEQACASNGESDMDCIVYSDFKGPSQSLSQPSTESPTELPANLDNPPERPPKQTIASKPATAVSKPESAASKPKTAAVTRILYQRQQMYFTSEGYISSGGVLSDDVHQYDYIDCADITIGEADDMVQITHMCVLPMGNVFLYDESKQKLMLYDPKFSKCQSSHQMQSAVLGMCTIRFGAEDRVYVVVQGNNSKSSEIIHFVIDKAPSHIQTKGAKTLDYESSGLTGYDSGIAVIQNMRYGRILLHLYNNNYTEDNVLPFDFNISFAAKIAGRNGPEHRYSLSTFGRGKLVVIADCKYNFVSIVDVERGQQILKYIHASLTSPSQVATYQDNIVFILCRETGNVHVYAITNARDQRRELKTLDTINLEEWSPGAMCCSSPEGKLYVSHSQIGRIRPFKLSNLKLQ